MHYIIGNSFNVKDEIKALGGRWDAKAKAWYVNDANYATAQSLVDAKVASVSRQVKEHEGKKYILTVLKTEGGVLEQLFCYDEKGAVLQSGIRSIDCNRLKSLCPKLTCEQIWYLCSIDF